MKITNVKIIKVESPTRLKAMASITIDNDFVVHDIKVIESKEGLFMAMPSRKNPDGTYRDIAHPINAETREKIEKAILEKYKEEQENEE